MVENQLVFNNIKKCRHGNMVYNLNDQYIGRSLDLYGEYSEGEVSLFDQIIKEGQVIIDIGANIGAHTVFFSSKTGSGGRVYAFEPQRLVFQTLCANMAINSIINAYCSHGALGETTGEIAVPQITPWLSYNFGGLSLEGQELGDMVPMMTLDSLNLETCHFIKIDVEGMELEVLKGGQFLLQRCNPVLYVENDRKEKSEALIRFLHAMHYQMYWHFPLLFNPANYLQNQTNIFGNIASCNMLCLPESAGCRVEGFQKVEV